ncbi:MAG: hypothetical protein JRI45_06800 [Deltaproteobacteria bacterium]|nr:hypothetical protein [Deltaproteobacteria bacterium]
MYQQYSLDEVLGIGKTYDLDTILSTPTQYDLDEVLGIKRDKKRLEEERKEENFWEWLEQAGRGFVSEATLGLSKKVIGRDEPETTGEKISRAIGGFAGFLLTPLKIGKLGAGLVRRGALKVAPKLAEKVGGRLLLHLGHGAAQLGIAEAVSDLTDIESMPARTLHGAKIGTIFGLAGMSHITKYPKLNAVLSQAGGRALLAITGEYPAEYFTKENLPQLIFSEALNTYFLRKGINPYNLLTGELTAWQKKEVSSIEKELFEFTKETRKLDELKATKEHLARPIYKELNIWTDLTAPEINVSERDVRRILKRIDLYGPKEALKGITAYYDKATGKYILPRFASMLRALRNWVGEQRLAGETAEDLDVVRMRVVGEPAPETPRLPTPIEAAAMWNKDFVTADIIERILEHNVYAYNVKDKTLRPIPEEARPRPRVNEIIIRRPELGGEWDLGPIGKKVENVSKAFPAGIKKLNKYIKSLNKPLPPEVYAQIEKRLDAMDSEIRDPKIIFRRFLGTEKPKLRDLMTIEDVLSTMEKYPPGSRMEWFFAELITARGLEQWFPTKNWDKKTFGERDPKLEQDVHLKQLQAKQLEEDRISQYDRYRLLKRIKKDLHAGKRTGTIISNMLQTSWLKRWLNIDKLFHSWTLKTGIPFWQIGQKIAYDKHIIDRTLNTISEPLAKFKHMPVQDQALIIEYYRAAYAGEDTGPILRSFTPELKEYIDVVDRIMEQARPYVAHYRIMTWLYDPSKKVFKTQGEETTQKLLRRAESIMAEAGGGKEGERAIWEAIVNGDPIADLGVLEQGVYLPSIILGRPFNQPMTYEEYYRYVASMGRTHLESRGKIRTAFGKEINLDDTAALLGEQNLNQRIHGYLRQVLNRRYMHHDLEVLEEVIKTLYEDFRKVRGGKSGFDLIDALRLYAHRKKGLPVPMGGISRALKKTQAVFFRVLTSSKPYLWLRNLFQGKGGVTVPHKAILIHPSVRRRSFKEIPEEYKERFHTEVSQMSAVEYHYLFTEATSAIEAKPIIGPLFKIAKRVGKTYSVTDLMNRKSVYKNTWFYSRRWIEDFYNNKIDLATLEKKIGLHKMEPLYRKKVRWLLARREPQEALHVLSKWMSDNSQWIYDRSEKSLFEMTGEGEAWTNLLTWSKSITQAFADASSRFVEGINTGNMTMARGAAGWFVSTLLAGLVANQILRHVSLRHGNKYSDYGIDMFFWELGGVSGEIVKDFTETLATLATTFDEPEEVRSQAIEEALRKVDNVFVRQLIPFAKPALAVVESITGRSHIQPFYEFITKKGITKANRTLLEGFIHAALATDPTKSPAVKRWANLQRQYWYHEMLAAKSPARKAYAELMFHRYEYLSDLFNRYAPVEVYKMYEHRERKAWMDTFEHPDFLREQARARERFYRDMRAWEAYE